MPHEIEISVASYTLSLRFDTNTTYSGSVVRQPDGVEAFFSGPDCLVHLLEGMVGRRVWQSHGPQIIADVRARGCLCA